MASRFNGDLPPNSFYRLNDRVYVSSPGFSFLQMACVLDLPKLIAYGDELCGLYAFDEKNERGMLQRDTPLITKKQLEAFIASAKGLRGYKQAKRALPFIIERSASPMETVDEMLLCLPYRLGGYAIRQPTMNHEVALTTEASRLCHKGNCRADISWPPIKFDLEYQGHADHLGREDFVADRRRINALRIMGYEVIELTNDQVRDWHSFEILALHTAKTVGHRLQKRDFGLTAERKNLRCSLFDWNASYGHR